MFLYSINMMEMLSYVFKGELDNLVDFLKVKIQVLEEVGVDCVVLVFNMLYLVFDELVEVVQVFMVSIVEEICKVVREFKFKKVGLLGMKLIMSMGFY